MHLHPNYVHKESGRKVKLLFTGWVKTDAADVWVLAVTYEVDGQRFTRPYADFIELFNGSN